MTDLDRNRVLMEVIQKLNSNTSDLTKQECIAVISSMAVLSSFDYGEFEVVHIPTVKEEDTPDFVIKELLAALVQCSEAFEFTRQYVGYRMLPAIKGWSWFDADERAKELLIKYKDKA